jgi:hypothetical protein
MKKLLFVPALLALMLGGCRILEPRPEPSSGAQCAAPGGTAPTAPPMQSVPDSGALPALAPSSHIITGLCGPTGAYVALGVDTQSRRFTFMLKGSRVTQQAAFSRFYAARVPVTVYTAPVTLVGHGGTPPPNPTPPPSPAPVPGPNDGSDSPPWIFDPCANIGDDPKDPKVPTGRPPPWPLDVFKDLSWQTAFGLDAVSDPLISSTLPPPIVPR